MSKTVVLQRLRGMDGYRVSDACFSFSLNSGVIAAAAAANSVFFSMAPAPTPGGVLPPAATFIDKIRVYYTCITAFATPVSAGRRLVLCRGDGVPTGGFSGTSSLAPFGGGQSSPLFGASGGHIRICDTAPLGVVTATPTQTKLFTLPLSALGSAGASAFFEFNYRDAPVGMVASAGATDFALVSQFVLCNPVAMDAGGTFELVVEVETCEFPFQFSI